MRTLNPNDCALGLPKQQLTVMQSQHLAMNGNLDQGVPQSKDSSGNYNTFQQGNLSGVLIRVGPSGSTDNTYAWTASNTAIKINHGLKDSNGKPRQPIGVHLVNSDKALNIYQPTTPDDTYVHVAPSDATAYATLYIF